MTVDDDGNIYLFTTRQEEKRHYPLAIAINRKGEIIWKRGLRTPLDGLKAAQIIWDGENLVLLWLDGNGLYTNRIDRQGIQQAEPIHLSEGIETDSFTAAVRPDHSIIVWFGGNWQEPGIYMLPVIDQLFTPILVDPEGLFPTICFDQKGTLHASWLTYPGGSNKPRIKYANYPNGTYLPGQQSHLTDLTIRSDSRFSGPWLGLDSKNVYIFWNEVIRSGRRINEGSPKYIHFNIGNPGDVSEPKSFLVPSTDKLSFSSGAEEKLVTGKRVSLETGTYTLISPDEIVVNPTIGEEIAVALLVRMPDRHNNLVSQVATFYLKDGEPTGYQLLSNTSKSSLSPAVITDDGGYIFLTWLERIQGSGFSIYLTSTAPNLIKSFSSITNEDVSRMITDTFFGLLRGAVFSFLFAPLWLALPGLLLVFTSRFRVDSDDPHSRFTIGSLVIAMVFYWVVKLFTLRNVNIFIPFSPWIPVIPSWLEHPLKLGVPIIGTGIALIVASHYTLRNGVISTIKYFIIYGGIDCMITLAVYGELLFSR